MMIGTEPASQILFSTKKKTMEKFKIGVTYTRSEASRRNGSNISTPLIDG
jgi:hypothetical protein